MNPNILQTMYISLLSTLPLAWCDQHSDDGKRLINRLNQFFRFDHNFFLMDSSIDLNRWFPIASSSDATKLDHFTPQTIYKFNDFPDITEQAALKSITSKNAFLIVIVESLHLVDGSQLLAQIKTVRKRFIDVNVYVKIGVFFVCKITTLNVVEELFRSSWSVGIVNIFCSFYLNDDDGDHTFNVFKYNPFGTFDLINVTSGESLGDYFFDKVPNYRKDPLRFGWNDEFSLRVIQINFWDTVLRLNNASMSLVKLGATHLTWSGIDIFYHQVTMHSGRLEGVYPYHQIIHTMIVPHAQPYSGFVAYLQNGTWTLLFVCAFAVIVTSSLLLIFAGYWYKRDIAICKSVVDVINLLINDNGCIKYQNLHAANAFVIVPLTFTGLIVVNGIFSVFQSFITSPIYQGQLNSIQDLYNSTVPIVCDDRARQDSVKDLENLTRYGGWEVKVHGMSHRQLEYDTWMFNNSIAFFAFDNEAKTLIDLQKRLGLKAYHMLNDIFLGKNLVTFLVRPDFPFTELIDGIVHRLNGAGLIDRWLKEYNDFFLRRMWHFSRHRQITNNADVEDEFDVPIVIWCGWVASATVFICEIVWSFAKSKFFK